MGTAAAGREANAESAEAAPRLEAAAEQQREHSPLAPTAGRGVEPVLPDPVPMLRTNSGGPVLHKIRSNEETEDGTDRASQMPASKRAPQLPAPKQKSSQAKELQKSSKQKSSKAKSSQAKELQKSSYQGSNLG